MLNKSMIFTLFIMAFISFTGLSVNASDALSFTHDDTVIPVEHINPVSHSSGGPEFDDTSGKVTLFTPEWFYVNAEMEDADLLVIDAHFIITDIARDKAPIALDGMVLAIPDSHGASGTFTIGDTLTPSDPTRIRFIDRALEGDNGVRVPITGANRPRGTRDMIYFDASYGLKTGAGRLGTEMTVRIDTDGRYVVEAFRPLVTGDDEGSEIPYDGFVLSAAGTPYQFMLNEDYAFGKGDIVDYIDTTILESQTHTHPISDTDPTPESNPGGDGGRALRGADQMIVYTDQWSMQTATGHTGTNEYGHEVAINAHGEVIAMDTNVVIPENGYVLSGHGVAAAFLRDHVRFGSIIDIDGSTIHVHNESTRLAISSAENDIDAMRTRYEMRMDGLYDVDRAQAKTMMDQADESFALMQQWLEAMDLENEPEEAMRLATRISQRYGQLDRELVSLRYALMVSYEIEGRGLWHRPNESNLTQIKENMDLWADLGFNILYVETLWTGYANHPSEYLEMHPDIKGNTYGEYSSDYLKAFITEAHKRGIEVHAWNEIFFSGSTARPLSNLLRDNPEWRMLNHDGTDVQNSTKFSDPANLELRQYLVDYHTELFSNYDLDGMQFDYIRYPSLNAENHPGVRSDSGYTEAAMSRFKEEYGITGDVKTLVDSDSDILEKFSEFRRQQVTDSLIAIRDAVLEARAGTEISMAIAPRPNEARTRYLQPWPEWIEAGLIDHIAPMIYHGDASVVGDRAMVVENISDGLSLQYTGIAPVYFGYTVLDNQLQIEEVYERGAFGNAIFAAHNVNGYTEFEDALRISTYRRSAITPHGNLSDIMNVFVEGQHRRLDALYIPADAVNDETALRDALDGLNEMPLTNAMEIMDAYEQFDVLRAYATVYLDGAAAERLSEDASRMMRLLDVRITRDLVHRNLWNPGEDPERPDPMGFDYGSDEDEGSNDVSDNDGQDTDEGIDSSTLETIMMVSGVFILIALGGIVAFIGIKRI